MTNITNIIHHKLFFRYLIIFFLVGIVVVVLIIKNQQQTTNDNRIVPGRTSKQTLLDQQSPFNIVKDGNITEYYVGDPNSRNNTTYTEKNGIIDYYLERNPGKFIYKSYQEYLDAYGMPDIVRYNDWYTYAKFEVQIFLKPGIGITVNPTSKDILEEWHFAQNLIPELFDSNYHSLFSNSPPSTKNQF